MLGEKHRVHSKGDMEGVLPKLITEQMGVDKRGKKSQ